MNVFDYRPLHNARMLSRTKKFQAPYPPPHYTTEYCYTDRARVLDNHGKDLASGAAWRKGPTTSHDGRVQLGGVGGARARPRACRWGFAATGVRRHLPVGANQRPGHAAEYQAVASHWHDARAGRPRERGACRRARPGGPAAMPAPLMCTTAARPRAYTYCIRI